MLSRIELFRPHLPAQPMRRKETVRHGKAGADSRLANLTRIEVAALSLRAMQMTMQSCGGCGKLRHSIVEIPQTMEVGVRRFKNCVVIALLFGISGIGWGQTFPAKSVRWIVAFGAGG